MLRQILLAAAFAALSATAMAQSMPKIIAHRGASGLAPENTLPAFEAAIAARADGVEFDVQLTRDGVAVVHHDYRLSSAIARKDGQWIRGPGPAIKSLTFDELQTYDVGRMRPDSKYAKRYPDYAPADGARVPTLAALLDLVRRAAPPQFELWAELKVDPTQPAISPETETLADAALTAIRAAGMLDRTTFISFHWPALYRIRAEAPDARLGFLSAERSWMDNVRLGQPGFSPWVEALDIDALDRSIPAAIERLGGAAWSVYYRDLTPERLADARARGLKVGVWTVRNEAQRRAAAKFDVDVITTDRPDWYR